MSPGAQVLKAPDISEGGLPAGKLLIDGLTALQKGQAGGEMLQGLVTHFIGPTELESGELIQDIQAGDGETSKAVEAGGVSGGHPIKPAAAPGPSSGGPVFMAPLPHPLPHLFLHLRRRGPPPPPGGEGAPADG